MYTYDNVGSAIATLVFGYSYVCTKPSFEIVLRFDLSAYDFDVHSDLRQILHLFIFLNRDIKGIIYSPSLKGFKSKIACMFYNKIHIFSKHFRLVFKCLALPYLVSLELPQRILMRQIALI